jgi:hypothetical protein
MALFRRFVPGVRHGSFEYKKRMARRSHGNRPDSWSLTT